MFIDLVSKMLEYALFLINYRYSPIQRVQPMEALLHPYFEELRRENFGFNNIKFTDFFNFTNEERNLRPDLIPRLVPNWYGK